MAIPDNNLSAFTDTDVLVIGAGIAGCIAAISLADQYRIILIDKLAEPVDRIGESLTPAARRILQQLDLMDDLHLETERPLCIQNPGMQSYWGSDRVRFVDHLYNPDGCVLNLNRKAFESFLRIKALERGVQGVWPVGYYSSSYDKSRWEVILKSNSISLKVKTHRIRARYVVDATGRQARFARSQGIRRDHFDALISCWASLPDGPENRMSTISAGEKGWWYSAPVPNSRRVIAYQTDPDLIDRRIYVDKQYFVSIAEGNSEMNNFVSQSSGPLVYHGNVSANSTRLRKVVGKQWVALGDAAMSFDPLSSQGMFHAMASAMQFRDLINQYDVVANPAAQNMEQLRRQYTHQMDQIWYHYRHHHRLYYRSERRWREHPFWKRRHGEY